MRIVIIVACAFLLMGAFSCKQMLQTPDSGKYTFEKCVEKSMKLSGPNPDDGDRHSAEMMCAPCSMPGGGLNCKKLIEDMNEALGEE